MSRIAAALAPVLLMLAGIACGGGDSTPATAPTNTPLAPQPTSTPLPMVEWPPSRFALAGLGPRRYPPEKLRADSPQLGNEELLESWRDHVSDVIVADN